MNNREVEQKLNKAFDNITPDILDSVKKDCENEKGKVIKMTEQKSYKRRNISVIAAVFAFVILTAGVLGIYKFNTAEFAKINLDVNPSIEISVSRNDKVLKAIPLNNDGEKILDGMDLKNTDIDVAVNAVLGSMLKNGFISDAKNSILLSVDGNNARKADELKNQLTAQIKEYLADSKIESSVLSQNLTDTDEILDEISDEFDISKGKAKYIMEIIKANPRYRVEELVNLNINELNVLSQKYKNLLDGISVEGKPSDGQYISKAEAEKKAVDRVGLTISDVKNIETEFDIEQINGNSVMIYEVEFCTDGLKYEIEINAETGTVIDVEKEPIVDKQGENDSEVDDEDGNENIIPDGDYITEEKANSIALAKAGFKKDEVKNLKCELEKESSKIIYEVEFEKDGTEYEYELDAVTGKILKQTEEPIS